MPTSGVAIEMQLETMRKQLLRLSETHFVNVDTEACLKSQVPGQGFSASAQQAGLDSNVEGC